MPGMDGFQVMERLKAIETDSYLPVLVITAQPGHKLRALETGAKDFISKPFDLAEVKTRIHNMLEVRLLYPSSVKSGRYIGLSRHRHGRDRNASASTELALTRLLRSALIGALPYRPWRQQNAPGCGSRVSRPCRCDRKSSRRRQRFHHISHREQSMKIQQSSNHHRWPDDISPWPRPAQRTGCQQGRDRPARHDDP
jgi:CheY-like chemotaxis protein